MIKDYFKCTIPNYPREVEVSKKRRPNYWKEGEKNIPKKYRNYTYSGGFLVDPAGNKVLKNVKSAGTPRTIQINAQNIYVGIHHSVRSKIVTDLHTLFHDAFQKQFPAKIAIKDDERIWIALNFHDVYSNKLPDLDNLANLFVKCGIDCLTSVNNPNQIKGSATHKLGIIPDDKACYINNILYAFTEVKTEAERKLEFNIYVVKKGFTVEDFIAINLPLKEIINVQKY